jgi:predicted metal-dependent HD superfamily phosphohydrolase
MPAVRWLGEAIGLQEDEILLIEVAAAFHDIGFTLTVKDHELAGIEVAEQVLPLFNFSPHDIAKVKGMILATRLPQSPQNLFEEILADADLDVLGRDDFFEQNEALRNEVLALGKEVSKEEWVAGQLRFIGGHSYFTEQEREKRGEAKQGNLRRMEGGDGMDKAPAPQQVKAHRPSESGKP